MKYFTIAELSKSATARARGIDNTPPSGVVLALTALIENVLDPAREEYGAPIHVHTGYRCPEVNKLVGGVANSQHLRGEAADIDTGSKAGNKRLFEILKRQGNFDQLINENDYSWIHVSYKRTGSNRKRAFALPVVALLLGLLLGCAKTNYVPSTRIERIVDTITRTLPDSAALRALFACDSLGQVYLKELTEYKGKEATQEVIFKDGELQVETKWRTQYIDRLKEIHDTTTIVREVEIIKQVKHIPTFFWYTFAIALLAIIYTIYKTIRKFKR